VGLFNVVSFCRRAFVNLVIIRPSGACKRISSLVVGCWVTSYVPVDVASSSGLMGAVVKVVFFGCHPRDCGLGMGGVVRTFLRVGALLVW
jgi:hypothetical protein